MFGCAMRHLDARPLTNAVGAEVRGLDVAGDPEPATIVAIRAALSRHGVVVFRDQSLDAPGLAAFSRRFGRLAHSGNQRYAAPDAPDVMLVGNLVVDGEWRSMFTNGMEDWHVDQIYKQTPNTGTLLYAVEVPPVGGDTLADIRRQMGNPLNVHRALASYPAWLRAWFPFRNHVVHGTSLSSRQYELVVLRVAALTDAAYEWEHHVITAKEAGLGEEEIGRVRAGGDAPGWSRDESALLRAVDECIADRCIRTSTLDALGESCSPEQVLDIVATVTMYHAMAIVTRTFAIPIDEVKPSFSIENVE